LAAVVTAFGTEVLRTDGTLDRTAVGKLVFEAPQARRTLEGILHPEVRRLAHRKLQELEESGAGIVFYMAPLLLEAGADSLCSEIWVIDLDETTQLQRVTARDGMTPREAAQRMAAQMPLAEKAARGDLIIDNRGSVEELAAQLRKEWERVTSSGKVIEPA
jgi:dephospho-CoA kinase